MWKLIDKKTGEIYENKFAYKILEIAWNKIDDYKRNNISTRLHYIGNCTYELGGTYESTK